MEPPVKRKKKHSSADHHLISSAAIGGKQQQSSGSLMTSSGKRRSLRVAKKMNNRILRKIWICNDVLMDIFPFFDHAQLGLKLALLSPRFNALVDKHFNGKSELTLWKWVIIRKDTDAEVPKLYVFVDDANNFVPFPLLDSPLPNKIHFNGLRIRYIDHYVIAFLRSNQRIFDNGTNLYLDIPSSHDIYVQRIWNVFIREIWPIFAPNIRHLSFSNADHLDNLRRRISPTILTDLNQLNSITFDYLLPDVTNDEKVPTNATPTAHQALFEWLHTPRKDGQSKRLYGKNYYHSSKTINEWVVYFKEAFLRASAFSVSYKIRLQLYKRTKITPFELVNERTKEKLTLSKESEYNWVMKRCQIGETTAIQWEENSNNVHLMLYGVCVGRLSPPNAKGSSENESRDQRKKK